MTEPTQPPTPKQIRDSDNLKALSPANVEFVRKTLEFAVALASREDRE